MDAKIEMVQGAEKLAMADKELVKALKKWHKHDSKLSAAAEGQKFEDWLKGMLVFMAGNVGDKATPVKVVEALRVNAMGDPLARFVSRNAIHDGFKSDINCYVEEGMVYSNVWLKGKTAAEAKERADRLAKVLPKAGYSVEVWIDPEDDAEVTVSASLGFSEYFKMLNCR